ncbi:unnamed protein product [Ilex paraguariensis]|uniref:Uncharacterized protein n=1 Tax=Ilex paraguariensis TaxID=185542 RepID=A0ABC8USS5_9AQUA
MSFLTPSKSAYFAASGEEIEKPIRMKKLRKCCRKLKKMFTISHGGSSDQMTSVSPPYTVHCDELFLPLSKKTGHRANNFRIDPFIARHIAAQNYFTMRPNIHI